MLISGLIIMSVEIMYSTHIYSFGRKCYKQREGNPIRLRGTCALARVVMGKWDCKWKTMMSSNNVKVEATSTSIFGSVTTTAHTYLLFFEYALQGSYNTVRLHQVRLYEVI